GLGGSGWCRGGSVGCRGRPGPGRGCAARATSRGVPSTMPANASSTGSGRPGHGSPRWRTLLHRDPLSRDIARRGSVQHETAVRGLHPAKSSIAFRPPSFDPPPNALVMRAYRGMLTKPETLPASTASELRPDAHTLAVNPTSLRADARQVVALGAARATGPWESDSWLSPPPRSST